SQAANARYLGALTAVHDATPLRQLAEPLCRPAPVPTRHRGNPPVPAAANPVAGAAAAEVPAAAVPNVTPDAAAAELAANAVPGAAAGARTARPRRVRALNPFAAAD